MSPNTTKDREERENLERRVEALANEIAELINSGKGEERNDLKDLALSVVREEVRSGDDSAAGSLGREKPGEAFNPIAIGIPLFLVGAVMLILFPPVGLLLLGLAGLMVVWGLLVSLLFSRHSKADLKTTRIEPEP